MPDIRPYGVTQHPDAAAVTANQLVGVAAGSTVGNAVAGGPAGLWSTAPHRDRSILAPLPPRPKIVRPGERPAARAIFCQALEDTCRRRRMPHSAYCDKHDPEGPA